MALTLYAHPLSSYCWKVLIPLYENGTPFTFRQLDPDHPDNGAEFASLWPMAKMPLLVDDGRPVAESSVIIEYLMLHHPGPVRLIPEDAEAALRARFLDRIFDNYLMTPLTQMVLNQIRPPEARDPHCIEPARGLIRKTYDWLETELAGRTWAVGEAFSLADCAAAPALHYANKVMPLADGHPVLAAYLARLEARPAFARVLQEAAPYAHLFPL